MLYDRAFSVSFPSAVVAKEQHTQKKKVGSRRAPRVVAATASIMREGIFNLFFSSVVRQKKKQIFFFCILKHFFIYFVN